MCHTGLILHLFSLGTKLGQCGTLRKTKTTQPHCPIKFKSPTPLPWPAVVFGLFLVMTIYGLVSFEVYKLFLTKKTIILSLHSEQPPVPAPKGTHYTLVGKFFHWYISMVVTG